jgi:hypothetical protein
MPRAVEKNDIGPISAMVSGIGKSLAVGWKLVAEEIDPLLVLFSSLLKEEAVLPTLFLLRLFPFVFESITVKTAADIGGDAFTMVALGACLVKHGVGEEVETGNPFKSYNNWLTICVKFKPIKVTQVKIRLFNGMGSLTIMRKLTGYAQSNTLKPSVNSKRKKTNAS